MLGTGLHARHLGRYRDLLRLALRYGGGSLRRAVRGGADEDPSARAEASADAEALSRDLERLGPTFVKIGQLLSTRSDLLPDPYTDALARLQDEVEPVPYEAVVETIEAELGARLQKLFPRFQREPEAAASLAQIHRAWLRDGTPVAVKVQRPGIRRRFAVDLEAVAEAAAFLDRHTRLGRRYEFGRMLDDLRQGLFRELDFTQEAGNLRTLRENLAGYPRILVPRPHEDYSTTRVLTMDFVEGIKITALSPLARTEVDGPALAEQLFSAYLQQILVDGFFHGDPHPGNVLITPDHRVALVDLGMAVRLAPGLQEDLLTLLLAISEGRAEDAADAVLVIGHRKADLDEESLRLRVSRLVLRHKDSTIAEMDVGRIMLELTRLSAGSGLRLPPEMTSIGKALLDLDESVWSLDPKFRPTELIRREAGSLVQRRLQKSTTRGGVFSGLLEVKKFAEALPDRAGRILQHLADNELSVRVDALDETRLIAGLQKIANRIAMGVMLGSLVIGAALMMRVETSFRIFEYPGLAILLFLAAAMGAVGLMVDILASDERRERP